MRDAGRPRSGNAGPGSCQAGRLVGVTSRAERSACNPRQRRRAKPWSLRLLSVDAHRRTGRGDRPGALVAVFLDEQVRRNVYCAESVPAYNYKLVAAVSFLAGRVKRRARPEYSI